MVVNSQTIVITGRTWGPTVALLATICIIATTDPLQDLQIVTAGGICTLDIGDILVVMH